jgi:hypothetical protein
MWRNDESFKQPGRFTLRCPAEPVFPIPQNQMQMIPHSGKISDLLVHRAQLFFK